VTGKSASAAVKVAVDPMSAFTAFTDEIDFWWVRGPINFFDAARAVAMRIEPGVGGRVLEIYDDARGDALELGRITVWEPGVRLTYRNRRGSGRTPLDLRPGASDDGLTCIDGGRDCASSRSIRSKTTLSVITRPTNERVAERRLKRLCGSRKACPSDRLAAWCPGQPGPREDGC
jgi:hypothetical protein